MRFKFLITIFFISITFSNCTSKKKILYFQDAAEQKQFEPPIYESIIKYNDRLSIIVTSSDMSVANRYNRIAPSAEDSDLSSINGQPKLLDYLVDNKGYINLPELGMWKVAGKTRFQLESELLEEYKKYIVDPVLTIRFANFKITILGEVSQPGTFFVTDERLTLPQALGLAGDLTLYGKRQDVLLLRDVNGVQESHTIDLTQTDVLDSDLFYLQQNDVLYVGQNRTQANAASFDKNNALYLSIASTVISLVILFTTR
ncbi:polysaccharide biosynthesis/export family protein [Nonlabens ponticola]|uniref:polysaccharide biosynthesis/export family protein n=1 Tax=Nonlabens ponticola TaxID=2496866 RepID=UPI0013DFC9B1|nr:polysaccharide biosynthesis/export family protein [Nonlabens ponticola]